MLKLIINLLVWVGTALAVPAVLLSLYDKLVAEPKRPRDEDGEPAPPPRLAGLAYAVLPWTLLAVAGFIGARTVLNWAQVLVVPLSWLAVPVALLAAYDHWVLEPRRPRKRNGEPRSAPWYIGLVYWLLVFCVIAVALRIGVSVVFDWLKQVAEPLSFLAVPVGLWCFFDSWFLGPRRHLAAGTVEPPKPPALTRAAYFVLPVLIVAVIVRMITAETLDFSLVLFLLSVGTGAVWAIDHFFFRKRRAAAAAAAKPQPLVLPDPGTVDYARSFFPVALIVLLVRAFVFEPFRIPSDSMMPTLLDGDFIVVNKYSYGLRWPVLNTKLVDFDTPKRGDVVVFRYPPDPKINFIKRLVGLPGDTVEVHDDHLVINGEKIALQPVPVDPAHPDVDPNRYTDGCYVDMRQSIETIGEHTHRVMSCRTPSPLRDFADGNVPGFSGLPDCDRKKFREDTGRKLCEETPPGTGLDFNDYPRRDRPVHWVVVPAGHFVAIGDNRDNSADSRTWGLVPEENLVGKATRIWFNFDTQRKTVIDWDRIGQGIE